MSNVVDVSQAMCVSHDVQNRYTRLGAAEESPSDHLKLSLTYLLGE